MFLQVTYYTHSGFSSLRSIQLQDKADAASVTEKVKVRRKQSGHTSYRILPGLPLQACSV